MNTFNTFANNFKQGQTNQERQWRRVSDFKDITPEPREWCVENWIPQGQVSLLYGDGGSGKTQLAIQLSLATAAGQRWLGLNVKQGPTLFFTAEDDDKEIERRVVASVAGMNLDFDDLYDAQVISYAGQAALFSEIDPKTKVLSSNSLYDQFVQKIATIRPTLAIIDTLADIFPGDENNRASARQFISMLRKPAIKYNCGILVLAHPSLSGITSGRGTSGSTGWSNSVRSRILLRPDDDNTNQSLMSLEKSNYSDRNRKIIAMEYANGVFVHDTNSSALDYRAASSKAQRVFLKLLEEFTSQYKTVNANGGSTYAPRVFATHAQSEGITKKGFTTAMNALLANGEIESQKFERATKLVRVER